VRSLGQKVSEFISRIFADQIPLIPAGQDEKMVTVNSDLDQGIENNLEAVREFDDRTRPALDL